MRPTRRAYLDWLRGVAVLCMIEWHVIASWTAPEATAGAAWPAIMTIGGVAAPLFLFLAGLSVPLAIAGHVARGADPRRAAWLVQRRGWEVFGLAHLLRLQSFLFNPGATWPGLFRPDILNVLGLGLVGTAALAGRLRRWLGFGEPRESLEERGIGEPSAKGPGRIAWLFLVPAAVILALTPWSRLWWWPTLLPDRLEAYIRPNGFGMFELLPWAAFVPIGACIGLLIAQPRDEVGERRLHRQFLFWGAGVAASGFGLGAIEAPSIAGWTGAWAWYLVEVGLMTMAVWMAWAWMRLPMAPALSGPLVLFGRTSLFVYWVHVELAFGVFSYPLHHALPLAWSIAGFAAVTVVMYFAARWWAGRPASPWIPERLRASN